MERNVKKKIKINHELRGRVTPIDYLQLHCVWTSGHNDDSDSNSPTRRREEGKFVNFSNSWHQQQHNTPKRWSWGTASKKNRVGIKIREKKRVLQGRNQVIRNHPCCLSLKMAQECIMQREFISSQSQNIYCRVPFVKFFSSLARPSNALRAPAHLEKPRHGLHIFCSSILFFFCILQEILQAITAFIREIFANMRKKLRFWNQKPVKLWVDGDEREMRNLRKISFYHPMISRHRRRHHHFFSFRKGIKSIQLQRLGPANGDFLTTSVFCFWSPEKNQCGENLNEWKAKAGDIWLISGSWAKEWYSNGEWGAMRTWLIGWMRSSRVKMATNSFITEKKRHYDWKLVLSFQHCRRVRKDSNRIHSTFFPFPSKVQVRTTWNV